MKLWLMLVCHSSQIHVIRHKFMSFVTNLELFNLNRIFSFFLCKKSIKMENTRSVVVRIPDTAYSKTRQAAEEADMSLSEWIEDRITADFEDDGLTSEEILNMDWDEKITVVEEHGLSLDSDDYDNDDEFAEAVIDELELEYPSDENNPGGLIWLLVAAVLGFFGWLAIRKPVQPQ